MNNIGPQYGWSDSDTPPLNEQEEQKLNEWHIRHGADGFGTYIASEQTPLIATVHELEYAPLIVAAPALLEALEGLKNAALDARTFIVNSPELRYTTHKNLPAESLYFAIRAAIEALALAKGQTP